MLEGQRALFSLEYVPHTPFAQTIKIDRRYRQNASVGYRPFRRLTFAATVHGSHEATRTLRGWEQPTSRDSQWRMIMHAHA
jgi:hypothetical protein